MSFIINSVFIETQTTDIRQNISDDVSILPILAGNGDIKKPKTKILPKKAGFSLFKM